LSSFYCFCFPSVQSFLNAYPHDQFPFFPSAQALSYASSTGLIGSPKKKLPQKSTRQNLIKESFVANRVGGMKKSGRAVGCFLERIESPKWKQRMKVEKFGLVPIAVFYFWAGYIHTYSQKMLYYYYYYYLKVLESCAF
jgi:hypothetical protein